MSSLREHMDRLERHRAAMGQTDSGRLIVAFTQDRDRSTEHWGDDAYAAVLLRQHQTALVTDPRAWKASNDAKRNLGKHEAHLHYQQLMMVIDEAVDGYRRVFGAFGDMFQQIAGALTMPPPQYQFPAATFSPDGRRFYALTPYAAGGSTMRNVTVKGLGS